MSTYSFRVLVGEHRALHREHARAGVVLGGDQLDVIFLAAVLPLDGGMQLRIKLGDIQAGGKHMLWACT
jgi:hypothetical protein